MLNFKDNRKQSLATVILVIIMVMVILSVVAFNLGLLTVYTINALLQIPLTTVEFWAGGIVVALLYFGICVYLSPASASGAQEIQAVSDDDQSEDTANETGGMETFTEQLQRAAYIYFIANGTAFLIELGLYGILGPQFIVNFFKQVLPFLQ